MPPSHSVTPVWVLGTSSMAANFSGCWLSIARATKSPKTTWIGAATAPIAKGMVKPRRW